MRQLWIVWTLGILTLQECFTGTEYNGVIILEITPQNEKEVQCLQNILQSWLLDIWKPLQPENINVKATVRVRIPSTALQLVKEDLLHCSQSLEILIDNVKHIAGNKTETKETRSKKSITEYNYTTYHPMNEIYDWMNEIAKNHSDLVTQHLLGLTYESRPMQYLKISQPSVRHKKIVWIDCGIHAREWIAPAFCQWFVKEIVQNYQNDQRIRKILQSLDIYVLPVLNIDGYIYSWTKERLWRKNRSQYGNGTCYGVDLNRNFNVSWCTHRSSTNCSSNSFCGSSPVSEPETRAVVEFVESRQSDIVCFLTIHSYSQLILTPNGYSAGLSRNYNESLKVAQMAASAMEKTHGTKYRAGPFSKLLYEASGTSQDWVHDLGIDFSFTLELRDNGSHKFTLPEDQIQPTCEETMAGVMTIIKYVNDKYFPNKAPSTVFDCSINILIFNTVLQFSVLFS
ncbi:carboxypeptidase O [Xenopus laevis]|uniref:Carboxypeptidase O n=1 Tax=Xenopus laevis TaxID=8355 RepID=A0A8J0TWS2_XENLA|nr:carboxypeptidase O [Xenopus laevis]